MSNVGQLNVELTLGVAGFQKGAAQAKREAQKTSAAIREEFSKLSKAANVALGENTALYNPKNLQRFPELAAALRENAKVMEQLQRMNKGSAATGLQQFINQSLGVGAGQNRPSAASYRAFWQQAMPPVIPPPVIPRQPATQTGGGGGRFGGLGTILAGGAGSFLGMATAVGAVVTSLRLLQDAINGTIRKLKEAFEKGFDLFTKSAQVGISTDRLFSRRFAASALNLSENEVQGMMLRQQGGFGGPKGGFETYRVNRQVNSLIDVFRDLERWSQSIATQWRAISGELYTTRVSFMKVQAQFDIFWGQLANVLSPVIRSVAQLLSSMNLGEVGKTLGKVLLPTVLMLAQQFKALAVTAYLAAKGLGVLAKFNPLTTLAEKWVEQFNAKFPAVEEGPRMQNFAPLATGQWEKLGLSFGVADKNTEFLRDISRNTRMVVELLATAGGMTAVGLAPANQP